MYGHQTLKLLINLIREMMDKYGRDYSLILC